MWIFFKCEYFSGVNIFRSEHFSGVNISQRWIFFRGEYFSRVNIFKGGTFFRGEYFSEVNISKGWIFFMCEYFSGVNIFQGWTFLNSNLEFAQITLVLLCLKLNCCWFRCFDWGFRETRSMDMLKKMDCVLVTDWLYVTVGARDAIASRIWFQLDWIQNSLKSPQKAGNKPD